VKISGCNVKRRSSLQQCVLAALVVMLALFSGSAASAAEQKSPSAILLIARGDLEDPNFADSVVLVMNNIGSAPVGIIINRPTEITVSKLFPDLVRAERLRDKIYFGGPVDLDTVWFLFRAPKRPEHSIPILDGVYLSASRDLLFQLLRRDDPMAGLRIFVGHSGWGPGQLEAELGNGDWTLEHAEAERIFHGKPEHPWPAKPAAKHST
jgi:putative transcriptional regulator